MNGILLVDKSADWTSHDVVAKLRGILHERKLGHAGTLDPMATGLLVVFAGRATRAVEFAEADRKRYAAVLQLGLTTDTQDTTGRVLSRQEIYITNKELDAALERFRGELSQIPPMYSAVKVNGQRLYKLARKGTEVARVPRQITVFDLKRRSDVTDGRAELEIECSKGTYVRTLCADIGAALGCGGAMAALRRVRAGAFSVEQAHTIEQLQTLAEQGRIEEVLLPAESLFADDPVYITNKEQERACRNGAPFPAEAAPGRYRVRSGSGSFLMLGRCADGEMRSVKNFF